ncbi:hypothetical protein PVL29_015881 [Vitis rotundifolia]|uniref:GAG-pre-integrase domain-containing protein n=1 Tax=Vitis rotundifolia TaxID=103349 RepID=A0AA39DMA2_VITRO|nr:hypothetical protein PVL29_015881 [Vitis rotundifolia]
MLDLSFRPEASALLTRGPHRPHAAIGRGPHAGSSGPSPRQSKRTYCEYCKKLAHIKDTCWAFHGKPADWKPKQPNKAHSHQASTETQTDKTRREICQSTSSAGFNSDQLAKLYELFLISKPLVSTFLTALSTMSQITPWIINSGASDHMTDAHHLFSTYSPCTGNLKVEVADGTLSPVASKGSIHISESITFNPVLHVPNLSCNLLSISQLTKQSNCSAKFLPSHCVLQDLSSRKTICNAKECEGLYYFDETDVCGQCPPTVCNSASHPKDSKLLLWHKRMGHPSFQYLKHLFPSLCSNKTSLDFQCEVCELAKHHQASFPKSKYKPSIPFTLIHSDLWGPSRTPNRTHKKWFITFINDHTRLC